MTSELTLLEAQSNFTIDAHLHRQKTSLSMALTLCLRMQALIHSRMRKRMQNMILELGQAKINKREALATINTN